MTPEEYKIKQQERISAFKVGSNDPSGYKIIKIHGRGDEFVVYEIETTELTESIKVWIDTMVEEDFVPINNYEGVREKFAIVKGLLYKSVDKTTSKSIISHILVSAIHSGPEGANAQFDRLIVQINKEYEDQFKIGCV